MRQDNSDTFMLGVGMLMFVLALVAIYIPSCTAQDRAKNFGGTAVVKVQCGQKVVSTTWKDENDLWYLTRPFRPGEKPEPVTFRQKKDWGSRTFTGDGKVVFQECWP
ncbi:MAG: hypothetical protein WC505_06010 [Patescibacteria group bacterium]